MDTSRIEELLEEISSKLYDINSGIEEINKELQWFGGGTFAEKIVDTLHEIRNQIRFGN